MYSLPFWKHILKGIAWLLSESVLEGRRGATFYYYSFSARLFFSPTRAFFFSIRGSCPQIWLSIVAKGLPSPRKYGALAEENRIIVKLRPEVRAKEVVL